MQFRIGLPPKRRVPVTQFRRFYECEASMILFKNDKREIKHDLSLSQSAIET